MDLNTVTPITTTESLRCSVCQNHLSVFPIRLTSKSLNICGRCVAPEDDKVFRNVAFESLSQVLKFPCRYKNEGCEEELIPTNIPKHEEKCPYRVVPCPMRKTKWCEWQGHRSDILNHCKNDHSELFLQSGACTMEWGLTEELISLLEHDKTLLVFARKFGVRRNILQFVMYTNEFELNPKKYSCQMVTKCANKTLLLEFQSRTFEDGAFNEMNLESVLSSDRIELQVTVSDAVDDPKSAVDLEMLSVLKCCSCEGFAIPPIYHCREKTLCHDCCHQHHSTWCQYCESETPNRNINLDKMANFLNYPCKNQPNGCIFIAKPDEMKKHHLTCPLEPIDCPLKDFTDCAWRGVNTALKEHFLNNHELVSNGAQLSKRLFPQRMKSDIIKFSSCFFRLVFYPGQDDKFFWSVQLIGPFIHGFKYEIEIVDMQDKGRRLLVRRECEGLTGREKLFEDGHNFCYFFRNQFQDLAVDQCVTFKVRIFV